MELNGERVIEAPRQKVWDALNDPTILSKCIPGCEEVNKISETETHTRVMLKVGPVRARFTGKILMTDLQAPLRCTLRFEGAGGVAGFAKGRSEVALSDEGEGTRLRYSVEAAVGGKLGQIGGRMIDSSAKKMADEFFAAFDAALATSAPVASDREFPSDVEAPSGNAAPTITKLEQSGARAGKRLLSDSSYRQALWFGLGAMFAFALSRWLP